ncbi:lysophospholipid acyltransferase family protein [Phaeovulum vinaykumarii]|uniref:1-acyl-sn-glycerol-3-phosphate acyltransferase n=1 Tax=Phaeovulum vinaykumarii TaxID=407234 RepID=A0A1N7KS80_9RHOB|nr:lysophospholipid acyltransferase family protein [Phaeovulum vinaykumarii]SIS64458.1 1-acyl-sn-glycerol-3-phosphate acyltransferase [Phaeovulum vinaykumarii]SOC01579.1 1-acyl-sn-glycerol-3-phosphate acyltransferase [Phaeovulum vinaykumarii]
MKLVTQYLLSFLFIVQMYVMMALFATLGIPLALLGGRAGAVRVVRAYCHWVRWSARVMVGLRSEIRGEVPAGDVLVCAKHQSFFDIILIMSALPQGRFIMKKELRFTPFVGWYAKWIRCIPVDRGKKGAAIKAMIAALRADDQGGQLIIFPQGTRVAAGVRQPYKVGAAVLYDEMKLPCVPVAVNVGVFWPRHGILRKPGLAVAEFLPPIAPGLEARAFLETLETRIETNSDRLMAEAGLIVPPASPAT